MSERITVTLLREIPDRYGDDTLTPDGEVRGCFWAPMGDGDSASSTENEDGRQQTITRRMLFAPPNSSITAEHRVKFPDNTVWTVQGESADWQSPLTGWYPGDVVHLERVTG